MPILTDDNVSDIFVSAAALAVPILKTEINNPTTTLLKIDCKEVNCVLDLKNRPFLVISNIPSIYPVFLFFLNKWGYLSVFCV